MGPSNFESIACNVCGADDCDVLRPSSRPATSANVSSEFRSSGDEKLKDRLVRCRHCGLVYVSPRPAPEVALDGYRNAVDETFVSQASTRERTFRKCLTTLQKTWQQSPGTLLDIGTANGSFLKVAKDAGWRVAGCEPNRWLCAWCKEHYGIDAYAGTVFEAGFQERQFDAITLWDVLEHTPDPKRVLNECRRLIKPGGLLVANYPDYGSWIARLMGPRWVFLLSVHYFYYTRRTIQRALAQAGFQSTVFRPHYQTLELDYILFRASAYVGRLSHIPRVVARGLHLSHLPLSYWMGQTLVIARPV